MEADPEEGPVPQSLDPLVALLGGRGQRSCTDTMSMYALESRMASGSTRGGKPLAVMHRTLWPHGRLLAGRLGPAPWCYPRRQGGPVTPTIGKAAIAVLLLASCASPRSPHVVLPPRWELAIESPTPCPVEARDCGGWRRPSIVGACEGTLQIDEPFAQEPIRLVVEPDGSVSDVVVPATVTAGTASSIRAWLQGCRFAPARDASGTAVRVTAVQSLRLRVEPLEHSIYGRPAPPPSPREEAATHCDLDEAERVPQGLQFANRAAGQPRELQRRCFAEAFRAPASAVSNVYFDMKFVVLPDGSPAGFQIISPGIRTDLQCAAWNALRTCKFAPVTDADGHPLAAWKFMPVRISVGR